MFVSERFSLSAEFKDDLRARPVKWGFGSFSEVIYYRTYSRLKEDGTQETWADTVFRVIEGCFSIRKDWYKKLGLRWNDEYWQGMAQSMALMTYDMKMLPPGRGLWAMGTDYIYERGSAALNNCGFVDVNGNLAQAACWAMDMLMCGVGVGFSTQNATFECHRPDKTRLETYVIPDSREGWVESLSKLLLSYTSSGGFPFFDYSIIRPQGSPIRGFGGTASGPEPLINLHKRVESYLDTFAEGGSSRTRVIADVFNAIGACVVAGNVRRSAELASGSIYDYDFLNLKDYDLNPERREIGWMSNNSVVLKESSDFEHLPSIASRVKDNGEPGVINLINVQKYGRYGKKKEDLAIGFNPCQPEWATVLTPFGIKELKDIDAGSVIWSGQRWTSVIRKWLTGTSQVSGYHTKAGVFYGTSNHKIVSNGEKVQVGLASSIDTTVGPPPFLDNLSRQDIMDGLTLGDGSVHKASNNLVGLHIGYKDTSLLTSEVMGLITRHRPGVTATFWEVDTSLSYQELPHTYERTIPDRFRYGSPLKVRGFLRGLYSANGSVVMSRITLKAASKRVILAVQEMLSSLGIRSYYTTNKENPVTFSNGEYLCKESYDLNVSSDRGVFQEMIGFIQPDKQARLDEICKANRGSPKTTYEIVDVEDLGFHDVYDITVEADEHTYWTGGLLVSNCAEIALESYELCNLVEVFPTRCRSSQEIWDAMELATLYASTVSLLPSHDFNTNEVVARNRRIGVSVSGIADWIDSTNLSYVTMVLREGYEQHVEPVNRALAKEAGVPVSVRLSTVKPSGTCSLVAGVSPGMHWPEFRYGIRRVRVADHSIIAETLIAAGVPYAPDAYSDNTLTFEFPLASGNGQTRPVTEVSIWEQASLVAMLQREWADNAVSNTLVFSKAEENQIERVIAAFAPLVKSISLMPHAAGAYEQMPLEATDLAEFRRRTAEIKPIDWSYFRGDGNEDRYCTNDGCVEP